MNCFNEADVFRRQLVVAMVLSAAALSVGCERLPWEKPQPVKSQQTSQEPPPVKVTDPGVLAVVNGTAITQEMYRRRVDALPEDHPQGFVTMFGTIRIIQRKPRTPEEKKMLLEELIKEEQLIQDAVALGLERDPNVRRQLEDSRRLILINALTQRDAERATLTDDEVKDHYNRFKDAYKDPERIHVRQIVTKTLEEAEAIRSHAVQGGDFTQLAQERSIGAGKEHGGDIGWHIKALDHQLLTLTGQTPSESKFFQQLEAVAFSLEVGQISQPVKGPDGNYYLVKLEERKPERIKALTELWDQLHTGLLMQKRQQAIQEHIDRLAQKGKVELNEQRLEQL